MVLERCVGSQDRGFDRAFKILGARQRIKRKLHAIAFVKIFELKLFRAAGLVIDD